MKKNALIMVDLQNDFCRGGSLAVPDGDAVIPLANQLQAHFDLVVATQDWHPANHMSFVTNHSKINMTRATSTLQSPSVLWPNHCVQNTHGAAFHPALQTQCIQRVFQKGIDPWVDSYSAFFDNEHLHSTGLADFLQQENVTDLYLLGLATDYCVKYSCLDALQLNFKVYVIEDACRGVELHPGDVAQAIKEMQQAGAALVKSQSFFTQMN